MQFGGTDAAVAGAFEAGGDLTPLGLHRGQSIFRLTVQAENALSPCLIA
jgi:hypothetical protein